MHALHTVHALPDLRVAGGRLVTLYQFNFTWRLDRCEPLDRVRVMLDEIDQARRLRIGLSSALFPVLQCADVGPQINREEGTRDLQALPHTNKLLRSDFRCGFEFHRMSSQRSLPVPRLGQRLHCFAQFREEFTRRTTIFIFS